MISQQDTKGMLVNRFIIGENLFADAEVGLCKAGNTFSIGRQPPEYIGIPIFIFFVQIIVKAKTASERSDHP